METPAKGELDRAGAVLSFEEMLGSRFGLREYRGYDHCAQNSKSEPCRGTYNLTAADTESKALFTYTLNSVSLTPEKAVYENLDSRRHPSACLYGSILSESCSSSKLVRE